MISCTINWKTCQQNNRKHELHVCITIIFITLHSNVHIYTIASNRSLMGGEILIILNKKTSLSFSKKAGHLLAIISMQRNI